MAGISSKTFITELAADKRIGISSSVVGKLAVAVASYVGKSDPSATTVEDLLNYFPARYEDRSNLTSLDKLYDGLEASVELYVRLSGAVRVGKNRGPKQPPLYIFELTASDRDRTIKPIVVFWFISGKKANHIIEFYKERFAKGVRLVAHGVWNWDSRRNTFALKINKPEELEILPPEADSDLYALLKEPVIETEPDSVADLDNDDARPGFETVHTARHVPVYRKLGPIQTKRLRELIYTILQNIEADSIGEGLPQRTLKRNDLISRSEALLQIHFPPDDAKIADYDNFLSPAHRRIIFEEFFWLSFALQLVRGERQKEPKGTIIELPKTVLDRIAEILPFTLTNAQRNVVKEIFGDMTSDAPMNRLIQGDVGSGKTIVAFISMFAAVENGYQTTLMAPTEILAAQHYTNAVKFFGNSGYRVGLLTGSLKASEKRKVLEALEKGEIHVLVGTHAIIQDGVEFEQLGLAVIDEQHRFGVLQRAALKQLGKNPDILVMTATPIPRSLAMTVYGDLDVSIIDELPPGRTPVKTVVVGDDKRKGVYKGIERELELGRQVYVVYPLIEESEKLDLKAATEMYEELRTVIFPKRRVGLLHGKMKPVEKDAIMADFKSGELDILVSTTVIEVGVDVPNASVMVIEHAERFGLSQLHQLRGRVGRGAEQSFCILLTGDKKTAVARERLGIMEETNDGFKIAEKDLEIRGQGEILGTRQAGIQLFKIANIVRDIKILEAARTEAETLLTKERSDKETTTLIKRVRSEARFKLAGIG